MESGRHLTNCSSDILNSLHLQRIEYRAVNLSIRAFDSCRLVLYEEFLQ